MTFSVTEEGAVGAHYCLRDLETVNAWRLIPRLYQKNVMTFSCRRSGRQSFSIGICYSTSAYFSFEIGYMSMESFRIPILFISTITIVIPRSLLLYLLLMKSWCTELGMVCWRKCLPLFPTQPRPELMRRMFNTDTPQYQSHEFASWSNGCVN